MKSSTQPRPLMILLAVLALLAASFGGYAIGVNRPATPAGESASAPAASPSTAEQASSENSAPATSQTNPGEASENSIDAVELPTPLNYQVDPENSIFIHDPALTVEHEGFLLDNMALYLGELFDVRQRISSGEIPAIDFDPLDYFACMRAGFRWFCPMGSQGMDVPGMKEYYDSWRADPIDDSGDGDMSPAEFVAELRKRPVLEQIDVLIEDVGHQLPEMARVKDEFSVPEGASLAELQEQYPALRSQSMPWENGEPNAVQLTRTIGPLTHRIYLLFEEYQAIAQPATAAPDKWQFTPGVAHPVKNRVETDGSQPLFSFRDHLTCMPVGLGWYCPMVGYARTQEDAKALYRQWFVSSTKAGGNPIVTSAERLAKIEALPDNEQLELLLSDLFAAMEERPWETLLSKESNIAYPAITGQ